MLPGLNPKKMQAMMKQLGIAQEEIDAERVIIETSDRNIIIRNPSVIKIKMQEQTNFQISGEVFEEEKSSETGKEEDIGIIVEKTGCSKEQAKEALENSGGDLAEAILSLS